MLDLKNKDFLSKENVKSLAPSIFTENASLEVSDKYTHIPTSVVIDDMEKLGWKIVDAKQVKARKTTTRGFQKHLIVFRNPDIMINGKDGDDVFPQILLTNSHDGKNAFTFTAGMFRMVCENGLVVSTKEFENVKIRHIGYTFKELQEQIHEMVERLPLTIESMNKMIQREMNEKETLELAEEAVKVRFGETDIKHIKIDFNELIQPTRKEDEGNDLWSIFNVIQEKIINGMFEYTVGKNPRKARQIKNFNQDIKINRELFDLALNYIS